MRSSPQMLRRHALAVLVALAPLVACRPSSAPPPVPPVIAGASPDFVARQKVVAHAGGQRSAFDAVIEHVGDRLVVLGLTPMGTKAFAIVQTGTSIEVTPAGDRPLPAPPDAILRDIHAAYFDGPTAIRSDGWHRLRGRQRPLFERWAAGRLVERVWGRPRDRAADRLRFAGGVAPGELPRDIALDHPRLDLRLEIHTLELTLRRPSSP